MHHLIFKISILCSLGFLFASCSGDDDDEQPKDYQITQGVMMLATAEGNFQHGNATAGLYNFITKSWLTDGFKTFNDRSLGDVCQSAAFWNGNIYLVVNNSGKIEVVNPVNFVSTQTITGMTSPRYMLPVSGSKAYVTDIYANKIWILSGFPLAVSGSIPLVGWGETMVLVNDKVWVVNKSRPVVHIVDPNSDQIVDSMALPNKPTAIAKARGNAVWIGQESPAGEKPKVLLVSTSTKSIVDFASSPFSFNAPDRFVSSKTGDSLFFLNGGVCMLESLASGMRWTIHTDTAANWYGVGYNPVSRVLVGADVKDYQQRSRIWFKYLDSNAQEEIKGGYITSNFYFF